MCRVGELGVSGNNGGYLCLPAWPTAPSHEKCPTGQSWAESSQMPPCLALSPAFHLDTLCSRCLPERIYEKTNGFWRKHTASMLMLSTHKARVWSLISRSSQTVASAIPGIELGVVHSILLFFAKLQYRFSPQLLTCSWEFLCKSMSIARVLSRWRSWRLLVLSLVFLSLSLHPPDVNRSKERLSEVKKGISHPSVGIEIPKWMG